jgi:EAL domain-containing protein (putative c-di-GMP-specific phosphodiesterase class I)
MAEPGTTAADLLSAADASMYRAKAAGRNRIHVFDESVREAAQVRLRIESGLRRALLDDELELWFQPQYAVGDHHMVGAEALLRWHHPTDGLLVPDQFLDVAEEVGLDLALDEWVVTAAARHVRQWVDRDPDFVVWVNISARGLADAGLPGMILAALATAGVGPGHLGLEVTERALIRDLDLAARSLDTLRGAGLRIAIDDFGTGFSSLAWLERLPLDVLKVDRSFTEGLGVSRDSAVIVRSVVAMAHSLGLAALAEGVETDHQLALLREIGCDSFQGYLAGRPVPAGQLAVAPAPLVAPSALSR